MGNYDEIAAAVYKALTARETVFEMDRESKVKNGYGKDQSCFVIHTEYMDSLSTSQDINFDVVLPKSFPLVLPKIYVSKSELEKYKNLPHVNLTTGGICTFDEDTVRPDPSNPIAIVLTCLSRAKEIIEQGVCKTNFKDYEDEFLTYWINQYDGEPEIQTQTLCLFSGEPDASRLEMIKLDKQVGIYEYALHQNDQDAKHFLSFLKFKKITFTAVKVCHLGRIPFDFVPPYGRMNKDIKRLVASLPLQMMTKFKSYINSKSNLKIVTAMVAVNGNYQLIGWKHAEFKHVGKRNGFRKGKISNFELLSTLQANNFVTRCYFSIYSTSQKLLRTDGTINNEPCKKLMIVGLGSIGSNLISFLNSDMETSFLLVDPDVLSIDNLNRHFLGFNSLWKNKASAMHDYLVEKNPLQKVSFLEVSIASVVEHGPKLIEDVDYLFMVTGKANIDEFMAGVCQLDNLNKPIFILWVEPYLSAGHCLYVHPNSRPYSSFFNDDDFFVNNVIDEKEYKANNPLLTLKQAGCHTSYVPYGLNSITQFIGAIFPQINQILNGDCKQSKSMTWIGNLDFISDLGVQVKEDKLGLTKGSIIIN